MIIEHPTLKWEEFEEEAQHWLFRTWSGTLQGRTGTGCPSHMKRWLLPLSQQLLTNNY
jgi:hypothetical protein